ncbi:MNIO family bufferin maturase [Photobacterium sp. R1]
MTNDCAFQQVGVGLRAPHLTLFRDMAQPPVGWLEVHSENYFNPESPARQTLSQIAEQFPISCHGIGLSLGSADPLNRRHLTQLRHLVDDLCPMAVSDHLSWSSVNGQYLNDLLPIPYTEEALNVVCDKVSQVQDTLGRQLLIENPSSYLSFRHADYTEWDFLSLVQQQTGCGLLLDLNNIYVSSFNHGFECRAYLDAINPAAVKEIHLAGFTVRKLDQGEIWIDTHSRPVSEPVWQLYRDWVRQHGAVPTLIEWDLDIPPLAVLLGEADKARQILRETAQEVSHECRQA